MISHKKILTLKLLLAVLLVPSMISCSRQSGFTSVRDGKFYRNGKVQTFIGTNFWYGPILASEGEGGDIARLRAELDTLHALGLDNLRVLAGADGPRGVFSRVEPTLQEAPGVYNDTLARGLDVFLAELGKRDMQAVLYLNNSWEWSGGYGQYMEWATGEKALIPLIDGYWPFMQQMRKFQTSKASQELFFNHVRTMVSRTNTVTGKPYSEDPAIFAWQIGNEPRCFSDEPEERDGFAGWIAEAARIVKSIDRNHLLSTGNEGIMGCEGDPELLRRISAIPEIDYMTVHIWPYNWGWAPEDRIEEALPEAIAKTDEYIAANVAIASEFGLPVVVEEFGYPRDGFSPSMDATTRARDAYYEYMFSEVGKRLQGVNFWGWSGFAVPAHTQWEKGDPYSGDPAQEAQGLNGVYITDTTIDTIITYNKN